jgi:hypothetical protein
MTEYSVKLCLVVLAEPHNFAWPHNKNCTKLYYRRSIIFHGTITQIFPLYFSVLATEHIGEELLITSIMMLFIHNF